MTAPGGQGGAQAGATNPSPTEVTSTVAFLATDLPWMPEALLELYAQAWIETGDEQQAINAVRASPLYDSFFAGNRRADGTFRHSEQEYLANLDAYEIALLSIDVNPDLFKDKFSSLIEGSVSPVEFAQRIESIYTRVLAAAPEVQSYYAKLTGISLSESAMVASAIDPELGQMILDRQISVAEIGGAASVRGFALSEYTARRVQELGISLNTATDAFSQAKEIVPIVDVLARRHNDPDDDFDIEEFSQGFLLDNVEERRRVRRLLSQERSLFSDVSPYSAQGGQVAGILDR